MPEKSPTHPPSPPKSPLNSNPNPSSDFDPNSQKSQPSTPEIQNPPPEIPFDDSQKNPDQETVTAERNQQMVVEGGLGKEQQREDQDPDYEEEEEDDEEEGIIMPISPPSQSSRTRNQTSKRGKGRPKKNIRKNVGVKKHEIAMNKKVQDMAKSFKPVPFVPEKVFDFSKHEEDLKNLGLWDFAHLELDSVVRADLIMQLIVTNVPKNRVSRVNGVRVKVSRADLARALKLPVKKPQSDSVVESFSDEFLTFLRNFVSNRMLLHAEEVWSTPNEVVGYLKMIEERRPQKVDWAGLIWFMMEKELSQGSSLEECYYASHFQQLIKDQREDLLEASSDLLTEVQEVVEVTLVDDDEGGDTKMLDAEELLIREKKLESQSMEPRVGLDCVTQVGEVGASVMGRKDGDSEVPRKDGDSEVAQAVIDSEVAQMVADSEVAQEVADSDVVQEVADSEVAQKDSGSVVAETDGGSEVARKDGGSEVAQKDGDSEVAQKDGASEVVQKDADLKVAREDGDSELAQHNGGSVLTELNVGSALAQHNVGSVLPQKDGDCEMAHKDDDSEVLKKNCDAEMVVKDCDDEITVKDGDADIAGTDGDAEMAEISVKNAGAEMGVKDGDTEMTVEDSDVMALNGRGADAVKTEVDDADKGANEHIGVSWPCVNESGNVGNNVGSGECADIHAENSENMYVDMAALGVQGQWLVDGREDGCQPFLQRCSSMAGAKMSTESTGPHAGIKDVEDEDGEIDGQVQGFKILPKSTVDGMPSVSLMEAFGTGQLPYAANEIGCSSSLAPRVDNDMMFGSSSLFNHSGKREIDFEHDISQHSLNENHKRMRMDGHWEHKSPEMDMSVDQIFNMAVHLKSAWETSKGDAMRKEMLYSQRLQDKDSELMQLRYKIDELQRKRQAELSRRDRELYLMNSVIGGYRRALKENQSTFTEYRKRCQIPDKPIYKDAGSGGIVKSITELKREQLMKEEEQRNMRYLLEERFQKILSDFEAELQDVAYDVEGWNCRLEKVAAEFELLRKRMVKHNTSENVEMMSEDIHNGDAQNEAVHHVQSVGAQDEAVKDNDPNTVDVPNEAVHNDVVRSVDVPNEAVQNDVVLSADVPNVAVQNDVVQSDDVLKEAVQPDDTDVIMGVDVLTVAVPDDVQSVAVPNEAVQGDDIENEGVQAVQHDTQNEGVQNDDAEMEDVKNDDTQIEDEQNEAQGPSELPSVS